MVEIGQSGTSDADGCSKKSHHDDRCKHGISGRDVVILFLIKIIRGTDPHHSPNGAKAIALQNQRSKNHENDNRCHRFFSSSQ